MNNKAFGIKWECMAEYDNNRRILCGYEIDSYHTYYIARCGKVRLYAAYDGEFLTEIGVTESDMWDECRKYYKLNMWERLMMGVPYSKDFTDPVEEVASQLSDNLKDMFADMVYNPPKEDIDFVEDFFDKVAWAVDCTITKDDFFKIVKEELSK